MPPKPRFFVACVLICHPLPDGTWHATGARFSDYCHVTNNPKLSGIEHYFFFMLLDSADRESGESPSPPQTGGRGDQNHRIGSSALHGALF